MELSDILRRTPNLTRVYVDDASYQTLNIIASQVGGHLQKLSASIDMFTSPWHSASHLAGFFDCFKCLRVLELSHDFGYFNALHPHLLSQFSPQVAPTSVKLPHLEVLAVQSEQIGPGFEGLLTFLTDNEIRFVISS